MGDRYQCTKEAEVIPRVLISLDIKHWLVKLTSPTCTNYIKMLTPPTTVCFDTDTLCLYKCILSATGAVHVIECNILICILTPSLSGITFTFGYKN